MARCPGDGECEIWDAAGGTHEERSAACADCKLCKAPPLPPDSIAEPEPDAEEISEIIAEIEDIAAWEEAGFKTDWSVYDFEYMELYRYWVSFEKEARLIHAVRKQAYFKAQFKNPQPQL